MCFILADSGSGASWKMRQEELREEGKIAGPGGGCGSEEEVVSRFSVATLQ